MAGKRRWTDDDLREAVSAAKSWRGVLRHLGLTAGGWTYLAVRERAETLGLDTEHLGPRRQPDPTAAATDDDIRAAHTQARSMPDLIERLGLSVDSRTYPVLRERMARLGLEAPGGAVAGAATLHGVPGGWSDDDLRRVLPTARSLAEVIRELRLNPTSASRAYVKRRIADLGLDTVHLLGQARNRGRSFPGRYVYSLDEILVEDSSYLSTSNLKRRLFDQGLKKRVCEICGLTEWNGRPIPLQLDHINGDRRDNRLENLRIVCPNCHAQTDTWCGKNKGSYDAI